MFLRSEDDPSARFGIRQGVVVAEPNSEETADIRQARGVDPPSRSGQPNGADEMLRRRRDPRTRAAGVEHALIETGVVGGEEVGFGKPLLTGWATTMP